MKYGAALWLQAGHHDVLGAQYGSLVDQKRTIQPALVSCKRASMFKAQQYGRWIVLNRARPMETLGQPVLHGEWVREWVNVVACCVVVRGDLCCCAMLWLQWWSKPKQYEDSMCGLLVIGCPCCAWCNPDLRGAHAAFSVTRILKTLLATATYCCVPMYVAPVSWYTKFVVCLRLLCGLAHCTCAADTVSLLCD
jgi:hypothetical protein